MTASVAGPEEPWDFSDAPDASHTSGTPLQHRWMDYLLASPLTPGQKRTGLVFATYGDADGSNVRPSLPTIVDHIWRSEKQVRRNKTALIDNGWLTLPHGHSRTVGLTDDCYLTIPPGAVRAVMPKATHRGRHQPLSAAMADLKRAADARPSYTKIRAIQSNVRSPARSRSPTCAGRTVGPSSVGA